MSVCLSVHSGIENVGVRHGIYARLHYHPQRSWGKVIFSEACVKNSVHRGVVSQHAMQVVSQHALQVSRPTPRGEVEGSVLGGLQDNTQGVS